MFERVAIICSSLIPKSIIDNRVKNWIKYAGAKDNPRVWIGTRVFLAVLMFLIGFLVPFSLIPLVNLLAGTQIYFEGAMQLLIMLGLGLAAFTATVILFFLHITYVVDGRRRMVENILPDFLFLVGNNLRSGMTPFYAFRSAVRPEFGPLSEEIQIATQRSLGVESFSDALKQIANRIDSKVLGDTTKFFSQALRSGGKLAQLIETSATDIKQTNRLKKELIGSTRMYTLFIIFVVVIASPMLLAVSVQFLNILSQIQTETGGMTGGIGTDPNTAGLGLMGSKLTIEPEFMEQMSYALIIANSVLASVFMGVLSGGKIRDGLKFAPVIAIAGIILFAIMLQGIGLLVGGFT